MPLRHARCQFSKALCELILVVYSWGYEVAFDEVTDRITEKDPTTDHMKGSLHEIGLAADLLFYKDGKYLTDTDDYQAAGEYWEHLGVERGLPLTWGGRFKHKDGNHFSLAFGGKA